MEKKKTIGVYIICKDEEDSIEKCIKSVIDADEIVVCDTGSTDNTIKIIKKLCKKNSNIIFKQIYISPFRFDDAKNIALSFLNTDICLSLDADEYVENKDWKKLLSIDEDFTRVYHSFETHWLNGNKTHHFHDRVHTKNYFWKLPVHEILQCITDEKPIWIKEFKIIQIAKIKETRKNYLSLLLQSVKEDSSIWKSWFFLAQEYYAINEIDKAISCMITALSTVDADKSICNYMLGKYTNNIDYYLQAAIYGNCREYWYYLYQFALENNDPRAEGFKTVALSYNIKTEGYSYNPTVWEI